MNTESSDATILATTKHWLTRAVIGLNLCPFAKSVYVKEQIRYVIVRSHADQDILQELESELLFLAESDPDKIDTTLLILPEALSDFLEYNDFLHRADRVLKRKRLIGVLQIASFHPHYQFSDSEPDAIENFTNRAPYPILHLLREASIEKAVEAFPDAATIYERNQETMRRLGQTGWNQWMANPAADNSVDA